MKRLQVFGFVVVAGLLGSSAIADDRPATAHQICAQALGKEVSERMAAGTEAGRDCLGVVRAAAFATRLQNGVPRTEPLLWRVADQDCLSADADSETVQGRLSIGQFQDPSGRPARPYILSLAAPTCLSSRDPDQRVESSQEIHIFASVDQVQTSIKRFVGKSVTVRGRPMAAHTRYHHAPIIMDIDGIAPR